MQRQVVAQFAMIVQVLVAQGQTIDALLEKFLLGMITAGLAAGILEGSGDRSRQPHGLIDLGQKRDTPIAGNVAAAKIGFNFTAFNGWKFERSLVAF